METVTEQPNEWTRQISGQHPDGGYILAVVTKRTYLLRHGRAEIAEQQLPLTLEPAPDPELPDVLAHDTDLFPCKPGTDVVVKGHAYGRGQKQFLATAQIGAQQKQILVVGDRACGYGSGGRIRFGDPAPVDKVPLSYTHAYGGVDRVAASRHGNVVEKIMEGTVTPGGADLSLASPYVYPRNSCGRGYIVQENAEAVEALQLPNLEDPDDILSPTRLVVGDPFDWPRMPMPQATDWLCYGWFPRIAYFGMTPAFHNGATPVPEIARSLVAPDLMTDETPTTERALRMTMGASLGLQMPHLGGGENLRLVRMHPADDIWAFALPTERPRLWIDGREGKLVETEPVIHTVMIEPDKNRLSIVWRGAGPARRPYMDEELEEMPFRVVW
ncbi:MAG: DUF2169 domain-containing protein [Salinisphaera sp.]|nr:DUF2169 domain-containing protein [Salinisphaera sp.]